MEEKKKMGMCESHVLYTTVHFQCLCQTSILHKEGTPLRPVVLMLGTAEYHLAKYLVSIMNENMPNRYMLDSNVSINCQLFQFSFIPSHVLVSYDVESLFTNIPLQETIVNVCKHVYQQNILLKYLECCCK